jgi:phosphate-selective porin OprO/OprP
MFFIGMAYSHQFRNDFNFQQRYRARPEAHITDVRTVNTGNFFCQDVNLLNPQMALVFGPFSLQAEYIAALTNAPQSSTQNLNTLGLAFEGSPSFSGAYAYISYFLTGEHRPFKLDSAAFDRVKPNNNFNIANGTWGAVEVAARWSYLALNSAGLGGGIQNDATFGVNWYLTPNFRWMFNYVYVAADKRRDTRFNRTIYARFGGDAHIVQTRFAIDF